MKRLISALIILMVIVLGGYFITGLVTEKTFKKNVKALGQADLLSVDLITYRRGLFKSVAELTWRIQTPEKIMHQDDGRSVIAPSKIYIFNMPVTMYHGPVIFEGGHLRFGLGFAHGDLPLPEAYTKKFHEVFTSNSMQPKLTLNAFITYLNKTQLEIELPAFKLFSMDEHSQLEWLGMNSSFVFYPKHTRLQGEILFNGLHLIGESFRLVLEKTTSSYDIYQAENGLFLGGARLHLPLFQLTEQNSAELKLKEVDVSANSDVNDNRFESQFHLAFESLLMHGKTYGPAELDMSTQNLDAEVLASLNSRTHQLQHIHVNQSQAQQVLLSLLPDVPKLLSKGAIFEISTFKMGLPEGLMDASLRVSFPETKKDAPPQLLPSVEGAGHLKIPAAFLRSILVRSYQQKIHMVSVPTKSSDTEESDATQVATVNLNQQATHQADKKLVELIEAGALQAKGSDYVIALKLSSGHLLVNEHPFHTGMLNF